MFLSSRLNVQSRNNRLARINSQQSELFQSAYDQERREWPCSQTQLELAIENPQRSIGVIRQLAAVLGILHRFREFELVNRKTFKGESLMRFESERAFFLDSIQIVCAGSASVLTCAIDAYSSLRSGEMFPEASMAVGFLLWMASDCRLDIRLLHDEEEREGLSGNLHGIGRL